MDNNVEEIYKEIKIRQLIAWDCLVGSLWNEHKKLKMSGGINRYWFPYSRRASTKDKCFSSLKITNNFCQCNAILDEINIKGNFIFYKSDELIKEIEPDNKTKRPNLEQTINLSHLLLMMSLLQNLFEKIKEKRDWEALTNSKNSNHENSRNIYLESYANEFYFANKVRNLFAHNGGRINQNYVNFYKRIKDKLEWKDDIKAPPKPIAGKYLFFEYEQYEAWHFMIVDIARNLYENNFNKENSCEK